MVSSYTLSRNTMGYSLSGIMDLNSLNNFWHQILDALIKNDKVNLYIEDTDEQTFAVNIVLIVALFPVEYAHKFNKIALVTKGRSAKVEHLKKLLSKVKVKNFMQSDEALAKNWVVN